VSASDPTRRGVLGLAAGLVGLAATARAEGPPPAAPAPPVIPADPTKVLGQGITPRAERSPFEDPTIAPTGIVTGTAFAPLQVFSGTITPTDLQFQRHHAGIAQIDPERWKLLIHGMVERPLVLSLADLKRFPSVTRVHFVECAGNGRKAYRDPKPDLTPQFVDGQVNNLEWTGVELKRVLAEVGPTAEARWMLAEGGDASLLARSVPLEKALDDALLVYAANGEALRPAHGYPVRLLLPGYEANTCIKWVRRLELVDKPVMTKDETSKYTDPLPGDEARQFSFVMDVKSIVTSPSHPMRLAGPGFWPISGIAWSGRGRIARVDVSTDGGRTWTEAELQGANTPKAVVRFVHPWTWDGRPTVILSRATDETGSTQPTYAEFRQVRGVGTDYHFNPIRCWKVDADGLVTFLADPEAA
jgi:sulfane dehydrogenase subunit SoxC